jgi:cytochrome c-type biogenesis protein CcmE
MQLASTIDRIVVQIAPTAAVIVTAVALYIHASRTEPRYVFVDEVVNDLDAYEGKELRVHGYVSPGTVDGVIEGWSSYFVIKQNRSYLKVVNHNTLPDTVRDNAEVIVTGRLVRDDDRRGWYLDGTTVLAKCPTKYEGAPTLRTVFK